MTADRSSSDEGSRRTAPALRDVLDALTDPAAVVGVDGEVLASNQAWALDRPAEHLLGAQVDDVLRGRRDQFEIEIAGGASGEERWTQVRASALPSGGALIVRHDVTARRMLEAALAHIEGREPQTGLLDGAGTSEVLAQRLSAARQRGARVALAQLEVAGLDQVREQLGAPAAVELMVQQVARIRRATRDDDVVCRIAEDRVLLICTGLGDVGLEALAGRLLAVVSEPCLVSGRMVEVSPVVGRVVVGHGASAQDALDAVDDDVRQRGRHLVAPATLARVDDLRPPAGDAGERPRSAVADRPSVRSALEQVGAVPPKPVGLATAGGFVPLIDAWTGRVVGAEVHVSAASVIEDLRGAASLAAGWERTAPAHPPTIVVALPEGWIERASQDLGAVRAAVGRAHIAPSQLVVRVSSAELALDPERARSVLAAIRALGVRVLLDGATDGALPLVQLVRFPIAMVRVDVGSIGSDNDLSVRTALLSVIVGATSPVGIEVIGSGVDVVADRPGLARLGCTFVQPAAAERSTAAELLTEVRDAAEQPASLEAPGGAIVRPRHDDGAIEDLDAVFRAMAHEIRTPLTVAMGYASMMETSVDPPAARAGSSIRRATERINRMLRNFEDVRMIDQQELLLELSTLDLRALVEGVVAEQRDVVGLPITVRAAVPADVPLMVAVDEHRIVQVLTNLISNAAKFSPPGAPIEVRLAADGDWAEVAVVDEGAGIPAAQLPVAFQKYGRADRTRPGSGLGLYLAQGVARAHGGEITYRHRRLRPGSVFALILPLRAVA
jgi:signal transduction histidine kinase/GGDEF domain-containing protein